MSELYTSLTQLKMALNDGTMPPMTPLTDEAKKYIDPDLTIGMGALQEDPEKGLRCPVRGCGKYVHLLGAHLSSTHRAIGGASAVRNILSIQPTAGLISTAMRRKLAAVLRKTREAGKIATPKALPTIEQRVVMEKRRKQSLSTIGSKNLRDTCDAQLPNRLRLHAARLGRTPRSKEVEPQLRKAVEKVYGSWNNALAAADLAINRRLWSHDDVISCFEQWVIRHGRMPTWDESKYPSVTPVLPTPETTARALGVSSWSVATSHIRWILGLDQEKTA